MKPQISITNVIPKIDFRILTASTEDVRYMHREIQEGKLQIDFDVFLPTIDKNLQRGFVWTDLQKNEYLLSIFKGYGISNYVSSMTPICIVRNEWFSNQGVQVWQVIDGKQRLSTILDFLAGKITFEWNGYHYAYNELCKDMQGVINRFWFNQNYVVTYEDAPITDMQKIEWFRMTNFLGTQLDKSHLENLLS